MGDNDAYVIAWANGRCATVVVKSEGEQSALFEAADAIATSVLRPPPS